MSLRVPPTIVVAFLCLSLWAALIGWLVSPWLEMFGLVVLLVLEIVFRERRKK